MNEHEGENPKSILDHTPVDDRAFPLNPQIRRQMEKMSKPARTIVGACCRCGSPIYGHSKLLDGDDPDVVFSCKCHAPEGVKKLSTAKEEGMVQEGK